MRKMLLICMGLMGMPLFAGLGNIGGLTSPGPFNPGYLGKRQALTVQAVTNFAGVFRYMGSRYQTNYTFSYETARKSTLSWQFGFKSYNRTVGNSDWDDYDIDVYNGGGMWGTNAFYHPFGEMEMNYKELVVGVKNYLSIVGSTAPYGGYLVANMHYGLASCTKNNLSWRDYYSSSSWDSLPRVGNSGVSSSMVSVSYGFGTRNMVTDQVGIVFEVTSGLTLMNSAGVPLYMIDSNVEPTQQKVMTSVMLREVHKSQWLQLKLGLSYLF